MKLEVGKKYVNRRGSVIEIYAKHPSADLFHGMLDLSHKVTDCDRGILWMMFLGDGTIGTPSSGAIGSLVREYEEPVKYTVDLWVKEKPSPEEWKSGTNFTSKLLGDYGAWHLSPGNKDCPRHLRITVEEVVE